MIGERATRMQVSRVKLSVNPERLTQDCLGAVMEQSQAPMIKIAKAMVTSVANRIVRAFGMILGNWRGRARRPAKTPSSPCVKVCKFTVGGDYCIGCRRTREEIRSWWRMSAEQQLALRDQLKMRRR